jgi:hypothetical protein
VRKGVKQVDEEYQHAMSELRVNNPAAVSYLQNVNVQM